MTTHPHTAAPGGQTMSDWQPIETAPKDGTLILGIYVTSPKYAPDYSLISWNGREWEAWADGQRAIESQSDFGTDYITPFCTHWMPLPAAPEAQSDV